MPVCLVAGVPALVALGGGFGWRFMARRTALPHNTTRTLYPALSFLNVRNFTARPPRIIEGGRALVPKTEERSSCGPRGCGRYRSAAEGRPEYDRCARRNHAEQPVG